MFSRATPQKRGDFNGRRRHKTSPPQIPRSDDYHTMKTVASELASYIAENIAEDCPEQAREAIRMAFCAGVTAGLALQTVPNDETVAISAQAVKLWESVGTL